jgi:hypothetical protein
MRISYRLPDALAGCRHGETFDPEGRERIDNGVDDRRQRADRAGLARTFGAQWITFSRHRVRGGIVSARGGREGEPSAASRTASLSDMASAPAMAAWARPDDRRRGRQAPEPGARVPGRGAHAHCEPNEGHPASESSRARNQVCRGLAARGRWIRTFGSSKIRPLFRDSQSRLPSRFDGLATRNRKFESISLQG